MALWIAPDDVLPRAIRVIAEWGSGSASVCLVRDTRGRIRVALGRPAGGSPHPPDGRKLAEQLADQLGSWFAGPIVDGSGSPAHKRIAEEIFSRKLSWPLEWPKSYENLAGASVAVPAWLVGKNNFWIVYQSTRNRYTLLLSPTQLRWFMRSAIFQIK